MAQCPPFPVCHARLRDEALRRHHQVQEGPELGHAVPPYTPVCQHFVYLYYLFTLNCCLFTFTHAARTIRRGSRPHSRPRSSPRTSTGRPTPRFPRQRLSTFTQRIKRWDYFIILVILDVLSYTVPHSINMTWRSIIDIFFCRAANRRSWCSTRWRSASLKSSPSSSRPPTSALWRRAPARRYSIRCVRFKNLSGPRAKREKCLGREFRDRVRYCT